MGLLRVRTPVRSQSQVTPNRRAEPLRLQSGNTVRLISWLNSSCCRELISPASDPAYAHAPPDNPACRAHSASPRRRRPPPASCAQAQDDGRYQSLAACPTARINPWSINHRAGNRFGGFAGAFPSVGESHFACLPDGLAAPARHWLWSSGADGIILNRNTGRSARGPPTRRGGRGRARRESPHTRN